MSDTLLLDSWAWLEMFRGTNAGKKVFDATKGAGKVYTTVANVYEVMYRLEEDEGFTAAVMKKEFIETQATVLDITMATIAKALDVRKKEKLPAIDAFTLASAQLKGARLATGDPHFRNVKGILYLGQ